MTARPAELAFNGLNQLATVAVVAWLARLSGRGDVVQTIAFGVVFMVVWRATVFQVGGLVNSANNQGTLELEMMSRAPIFCVLFGKLIATISFYGLIGIGGFALVLLIGGAGLAIDHPTLLAISLGVSSLAVGSTAFLFAPLTFVVGGRPGFFNAIIPIGVVLSSFVQPPQLLPLAIQLPARFLATSWAMDGLSMTLRNGQLSAIFLRWAAAVALSLVTLGFSAWLLVKAEQRVRGLGNA